MTLPLFLVPPRRFLPMVLRVLLPLKKMRSISLALTKRRILKLSALRPSVLPNTTRRRLLNPRPFTSLLSPWMLSLGMMKPLWTNWRRPFVAFKWTVLFGVFPNLFPLVSVSTSSKLTWLLRTTRFPWKLFKRSLRVSKITSNLPISPLCPSCKLFYN